MKNRLFLIPLIVFGLLMAGLGVALWHNRGQIAQSKFADHSGEAVPALALDGYDPAAERGKPYIVNFFASWCAPCRAEHEQILALQMEGATIIGIAYSDPLPATQKFLRERGDPYKLVAHDNKGTTAIAWGITGVPETFLIDRLGIIRLHYAGPLTKEDLEEKVLPVWRGLQ